VSGQDDRPPPPILVTGSHRSGTTWVGAMMAAAHHLAHVHEPLNPANRSSWLGSPPAHAFVHITGAGFDVDGRSYGPAFDRIVALRPPLGAQLRSVRTPRHLAANAREAWRALRWRATGARVLVKDPLAVLSAEWFARRYAADVVVLVRHPAAFAGSLKRLGWTFDFGDFTRQPALLDGWLRPFVGEIERAAEDPPDIIDQAVLLWRCLNHTVGVYAADHPDWTVVRYEDVAADPMVGARRLFAEVGLGWDDDVAERVARLSSADNPAEVAPGRTRDVRRDSVAAMWTWTRRLDRDEIARVRRGTEDVAGRFYSAEDWVAPPAVGADASSRSSSAT
jgi:hypothetical protein